MSSHSESSSNDPHHHQHQYGMAGGSATSHPAGPYGELAGPSVVALRAGGQRQLIDHRSIPSVRLTDAQERQLFSRPLLPDTAMTDQQKCWSDTLLFPPEAAFRKDVIMRAWLSASIPGEFRRNNNCLKQTHGSIAHIGREKLNIGEEYWEWLLNSDAPPHPASALLRRNIRCDEIHNLPHHSTDDRWFVCPHEHHHSNPRITHTYEHLVCRACEVAQPAFCAPLVRQMLTDGPLVAMCERCAISALSTHGPGYNGCTCTDGAFGTFCLQHQNEAATPLAHRYLAYRAQHHGPGGHDESVGQHVTIPYCKCGRPPVPRSRNPFAFWCAGCEHAVILPDDAAGRSWQTRKKPQRWLLSDTLPKADFDADWITRPSDAPPYGGEGPPINPDDYRPVQRRRRPVYPPRLRTPERDPLLPPVSMAGGAGSARGGGLQAFGSSAGGSGGGLRKASDGEEEKGRGMFRDRF